MIKTRNLICAGLLFFGLLPGGFRFVPGWNDPPLQPARQAPSNQPAGHDFSVGPAQSVRQARQAQPARQAKQAQPAGQAPSNQPARQAQTLRLVKLFQLVPLWASDLSGDEVLRHMEETLFPESYRMRVSMVTTEASGRERGMELDVHYRRDTGSYMEVLSPARSRGTRFLQRDNALWMFIPRGGSRSAIRLASRDSFQGSVFSNSDLGESSYTDDYQGRVTGRETVHHPELGGVETYVVQAEPKHPEAAYGRIVTWVTVEGFIPLRMDYYVRSGMHIKQMKLSDIQEIAARRRPLRMEMEALDEAGKVSVMRVLELEQDDNIPDRLFTQRHLTR